MTDDIFVYFVKLPSGIKEITLPCFGGHTIYIDSSLTQEQKKREYKHALDHIRKMDFEKYDVQQIEYEAHRRDETR